MPICARNYMPPLRHFPHTTLILPAVYNLPLRLTLPHYALLSYAARLCPAIKHRSPRAALPLRSACCAPRDRILPVVLFAVRARTRSTVSGIVPAGRQHCMPVAPRIASLRLYATHFLPIYTYAPICTSRRLFSRRWDRL